LQYEGALQKLSLSNRDLRGTLLRKAETCR
jgi:hypothetical protein